MTTPKHPETVLCPWNTQVEQLPNVFKKEPEFLPSGDRPLIYHLFGRYDTAESLVLTEDDHFQYLIGISRNNEVIPLAVRNALSKSSLMLLGFRVEDWPFRVAFRSLLSQEGSGLLKNYAHIGAQVAPEEDRILVEPLAHWFAQTQPRWAVDQRMRAWATKAGLMALLGGVDTPAMLFTASRGVGFRSGHARQLRDQGALLCAEWPGPVAWHGELPQRFYVSAEDIPDDVHLLGLIGFHFACFGGGTPQFDEFAGRALNKRPVIAPRAFVARLAQRLLGHPNGSALAIIAHVDRAWGYSFNSSLAGPQLQVFQDMLTELVAGSRVGAAMEAFNVRYAELSTDLTAILDEAKWGTAPDPSKLAGMWTANNDARNYLVLGDPAVQLAARSTDNQAMS